MPYNDDENHSLSEFYYPEQTNDRNKSRLKVLAAKAFFGLFYKVTTNCNPTKRYNKSLINRVRGLYGKVLPEVFRTDRATKERGLCDKNRSAKFYSVFQFEIYVNI